VKKTIGGTITRFAYDGYNVIDERNNSGTSVASTLTGLQLDELLLRTDANGTQGYLTDLIGSTLALSGSSGVSTEYTYGPYGATSQSGPASANTFRYTGREEDPPGLYYYRSRYYSPQTGRFLSEDSIRFRSGDYSLCRYARNSPVMFRDPSGHQIGVPGFGGAGLPPGDFGFPPGPLAPPDSGCPPGDWSDIIAPIDHAIGILLWGRGMAGGGFECPLCGPPTPKPGTGPFPNDPPGT
jgi:RHS repeat-associated protein